MTFSIKGIVWRKSRQVRFLRQVASRDCLYHCSSSSSMILFLEKITN